MVWNWVWLESDKFDNLHFAALKETDMDKRASMYNLNAQSYGRLDFLFIMHPPSVVMYRDNIKPGLYPNGGFKLSDFQVAN